MDEIDVVNFSDVYSECDVPPWRYCQPLSKTKIWRIKQQAMSGLEERQYQRWAYAGRNRYRPATPIFDRLIERVHGHCKQAERKKA